MRKSILTAYSSSGIPLTATLPAPKGAESSAGRGIPSPSPANRFAGFAGDFFTGDGGRGTGDGERETGVVGFVENSLWEMGVLWNLAGGA